MFCFCRHCRIKGSSEKKTAFDSEEGSFFLKSGSKLFFNGLISLTFYKGKHFAVVSILNFIIVPQKRNQFVTFILYIPLW